MTGRARTWRRVGGGAFVVTAAALAMGCVGDRTADGGPVACPDGLATAAEIAATPRADAEAEGLALTIDRSLVATEAVYQRVRALYHYAIDRGSGDCPAGCIHHDVYGFDSLDGAITTVDEWHSDTGAPRPEWLERLVAAPAGPTCPF
ncbi:MAG TPA: hypothetical protein VGQ83_34360 [Polyangia bacterium]